MKIFMTKTVGNVGEGRGQRKLQICVTATCWCLYWRALRRPYRLVVRTPPFHGGGPGSNPGRVASSNHFTFLQSFSQQIFVARYSSIPGSSILLLSHILALRVT